MNKLGISYNASYLVQGTQLERCKVSANLNLDYIELKIRSDGKDSNISSLSKAYKGNIIFNLPAINPDLSNLKVVNDLAKKIKNNSNLITINASNLSLDLFEWSTLDEQKRYFLNIVTSISTIASNKIEVAIENLKSNDTNSMFGSNISQITDIIVYSRRLLVKDFGFTQEESENYIGLSLNIDNIDDNEKISDYFEIFNKSIKLIKISNKNQINKVLNILKEKKYEIPLLLETSSELEEIKKEYIEFENIVFKNKKVESKKVEVKKKDYNKISNIIIASMIILTIVIVILMFIIKFK